MEPLVSVICVTRNHERFCIESLDSVLNQTYKNIEWIILDAASTDDTAELIDNWLVENNVNAIFLKEKELKPITVNLNKALTHAHGEYVQFLSLDDLLIEEKIENQVADLTQNRDCAFVYSDACFIDETNKVIQKSRLSDGYRFSILPIGNIYEELITREYFICAPTLLWSFNSINSLNRFQEKYIVEDLEIVLRAARFFKVSFINEITVYYRVVEGSLSHSNNSRLESDVVKIYLREYISAHRKNKEKLGMRIFELLVDIYQSRNFKFKKLFLLVFFKTNLKKNFVFFLCYLLEKDFHVYKYLTFKK